MVVGSEKHISDLQNRGWVSTGKSFPVFKHPEMPDVDLAFARGETKTGTGHNAFSYHLANSIEEDLSRRDLTVNAMAWNPRRGLVDPHGGQHDLSKGVLRHVSNAFREDPLRVFRTARFAAKFDFSVDPVTSLIMGEMLTELNTLSKDRVREEFLKALESDHPTKFFTSLSDADVLRPWFHTLDDLRHVPAGKPEWHPEGDTFSHTMFALQYCADKGLNTLTRIFALCHDFGKEATEPSKWPAHHGHESRTGAADAMLDRLGFNETVRRQTATHIRHHLLPNQPRLRPTTVVNYWKATRRIRDEHFGAYHADINGHGAKEYKESPRVAQLRDIFADLDNVEVVPSKNVQNIHQQFQRAAATSMAKKPSVESNWK
jgi:tRNA nucleotidyltransferase (CCA-adding enzyme)